MSNTENTQPGTYVAADDMLYSDREQTIEQQLKNDGNKQELDKVTKEMHGVILQNRKKSSAILSMRVKGYLTLFSGFVWMLYLGSHFMVGNISPYIGSYFDEATNGQAQTLFPIIVFSSMFFNFLGCQLVKRGLIHPKAVIAIGATIGIGGCFLCTFTTNWTLFRYVFPATYGIAVGFTFMVHLFLSWKYIPGYEGIITGVINAGFGCGGAFFNYLSIALVNPDGVDAIKPTEENPDVKPFGREVADNVPTMLRTLCYIWLGIFIVAFLTIQGYPPYDELQKEKVELQEKQVKYKEIQNKIEKDENRISHDSAARFEIGNSLVSRSQSSSLRTSDYRVSTTVTQQMMEEHQHLQKERRVFSVYEDRNAFFMQKNSQRKGSEEDEGLVKVQNAKVDLEAVDRTKLTNMVLTIISERLEDVEEVQEFCLVIETATLVELLKTRQFIEIFLMAFSSVLVGLFIIGSSKAYGEKTIGDEEFLTITAACASILNIFRFIWSSLMEKYGFKLVYTILLSIQLVVSIVLPLMTKYSPKSQFTKYFFLLAVSIMQLTEGGLFVIVPTIFAKIFGVDGGMRVYSVGFCFVGLASLCNTIVLSNALDLLGYEGFIYIYGLFNLGALLYLVFRFKFKKVTCCDLQKMV